MDKQLRMLIPTALLISAFIFNPLVTFAKADTKNVAKVIYQHTRRPFDIVSRYGGEEFVVLLPHTHIEGAFQLADSVVTALYANDFEHQYGVDGRVTVSAGVATQAPAHDVSPQSLVGHADKALYHAKNEGRNCAIRAPQHSE